MFLWLKFIGYRTSSVLKMRNAPEPILYEIHSTCAGSLEMKVCCSTRGFVGAICCKALRRPSFFPENVFSLYAYTVLCGQQQQTTTIHELTANARPDLRDTLQSQVNCKEVVGSINRQTTHNERDDDATS